jgi:hypothetical protein
MGASDVEPGQAARLLPESCVEARHIRVLARRLDRRSFGRLETSGEVTAHAKLRSPADVDERLFASWLEQACALELDTSKNG